MTTTPFSALPLEPAMLANLKSLGYHEMTPIQAQSLPYILNNRDLIAKAKTGSGKTAAFGIGLLAALNTREFRVQALVLCPTRELADQVSKELRRLARATHNVKILSLCGGQPLGPQLGSLQHGAHIAVGTPGRILEHLRKGSLQLGSLKALVLDEADRMLDMGFHDAIREIVAATPEGRQTLLFSATYPEEIRRLSAAFQRNPVEVSVEALHTETTIEQRFYEIKQPQRLSTLAQLFRHYPPQATLVFCNTKKQCQEVAAYLAENGFYALAIHGDLEQRERDQVLVRFANNSCSILVATDVAARGLDIAHLQAVINYELSRDPEIHIHRIGRTGRAGKTGLALSLYTEAEQYKLNAIEAYQNSPCIRDVPESLDAHNSFSMQPPMITLQIDSGRKNKLRPGDILGALTGELGMAGEQVGKIDIFDFHAYVAVERACAGKALRHLCEGRIKGRKVKARKLS